MASRIARGESAPGPTVEPRHLPTQPHRRSRKPLRRVWGPHGAGAQGTPIPACPNLKSARGDRPRMGERRPPRWPTPLRRVPRPLPWPRPPIPDPPAAPPRPPRPRPGLPPGPSSQPGLRAPAARPALPPCARCGAPRPHPSPPPLPTYSPTLPARYPPPARAPE